MTSSLAIATVLICAGCGEETANAANADVPIFTNASPAPAIGDNDAKTTPAAPQQPKPADSDPTDADAEEPADKAKPARVVDKAVVPEDLKVSPALEEIIKLVQAGISEDVIMSYVTNSTNFFNVGSDQIVYLNDLGVSTTLVTALIQHDSSPQMASQRKALETAKPLPAGAALTTPAPNVYPGAPTQEVANLPETALPPSYEEPPPATVTYEQAPANVSYFYSSLAPYGNWVDVNGYGLCWQPTVAVVNSSWRPYCDRGRWLWSDCGWYWYSDYSWGWAPFHYGRWCTYPRLGWVWVPDTCWGPSWVSWRYNNSYCGWAPLPPVDFHLSPFCWPFIPIDRFCHPKPHLYYVSGAHAARLHRATGGAVRNAGPGRDTITRATREQIPTVRVRDTALVNQNVRRERLEGNGSTLVVTRPQLPTTPPASPTIVAAKVSGEPKRNVAASSIKNSGDQPKDLLDTRLAGPKPVRPAPPGSGTVAASPQSAASPRLKTDSEPAKSPGASTAARNGRTPISGAAPQKPITSDPEPAPGSVVKGDPTETPAIGDKPGTGKKSEPSVAISRSSKTGSPAANTRPQPQRPRTFTPPLILGADPVDATPKANGNSTRPAQPAPAARTLGNPSLNAAAPQQGRPTSDAVRQGEPRGGETRPGNYSRPPSSPGTPSLARQPLQTTPAPQAYGKPAGVPSSSPRSQNAAPSVSRPPERYRIYAEPPSASRSANPPQASRPQVNQPSVPRSTPLPAPAARPQFTAPRAPVAVYRSEPARAPGPAPAVRSEPARSSGPPPSNSGSSGRSQAPSNSGGGRPEGRR